MLNNELNQSRKVGGSKTYKIEARFYNYNNIQEIIVMRRFLILPQRSYVPEKISKILMSLGTLIETFNRNEEKSST